MGFADMSHLGVVTPVPPPRPVAEMHTGANYTREFLSRMSQPYNLGHLDILWLAPTKNTLNGQLIFSMPRTSSIYVIFIFFSYQFHLFFFESIYLFAWPCGGRSPIYGHIRNGTVPRAVLHLE
jgi:hypothetical protein